MDPPLKRGMNDMSKTLVCIANEWLQVEGADAPMPEGRQDIPGTYNKRKQDISESFYKFEIRNLLDENETKSVISGNILALSS